MQIDLYYIGKKKKHIYQEAEGLFTKRLKNYCKFNLNPIVPSKYSSALSTVEIKSKEENLVLSKLKAKTRLILLDELGKNYNSIQFAQFNQRQFQISSHLTFVIGGAFGFSANLKKKADELISLSGMTFPHHLARIVFLEQLYRAFSINNNEPYHNN